MRNEKIQQLIDAALNARKRAYAPYSHYMVGAAVLGDNEVIYTGCNIENSSFGATNCAERTAIFKAVSEGEQYFTAIAIAGGLDTEMEELKDYAFPCGICRQVMAEFCDSEFIIIVAKSKTEYKNYTLGELLACSFTGDKLS